MIALVDWVLARVFMADRGSLLAFIGRIIAGFGRRSSARAGTTRARLHSRDVVVRARRSVVLSELRAESWLTRSWRPLLMLLLMGFLLFFGFVLPFIEMVLGHRLSFVPRFDLLPDAVWNLLTVGVGGYVGGRSVEKIAASWVAASRRSIDRRRAPIVRKRRRSWR
jgi:hypothetical protein